MTRVLVTGANGFVGRTVCSTLAEHDKEVRAAVRSPDRLPAQTLAGEVTSVGEIGPSTDWSSALAGVDAVVHLAGRVHVLKETFDDPQSEFYKINVLGTGTLARQAAEAGVRRLIYVSSVGVNGRSTPRTDPFTENHEPMPHNPYAVSKLEAEQELRRVSAETGLEVVILRPPLVYGPGVKANFLRLMKLADLGVPLPFGSVRNSRSLVYVANLADAILTCIEHPGAAGEVFLVSDGKDVSTPELMGRIAGALDRPARLLPFPPRLLRTASRWSGRLSAMDPLLNSLTVDSGRIRRVLGWQPPHPMEDGIKETARWFRAEAEEGAL